MAKLYVLNFNQKYLFLWICPWIPFELFCNQCINAFAKLHCVGILKMFCITYWLTLKYCSKWLGGAISSSQLINHVGFWKCKECLVVYITSVDNFFWCRQNVDPHRCQCHKPWTSLATEYVATVQVLTDWVIGSQPLFLGPSQTAPTLMSEKKSLQLCSPQITSSCRAKLLS